MSTLLKTIVAAAALGATGLVAAAPAQARYHDGNGALVAGIVGLGIGAAIASSANHNYGSGYYGYDTAPAYYAPSGYYGGYGYSQPYYGGYGYSYDRRDYGRDRHDWNRHDRDGYRGHDRDDRDGRGWRR